MLFVIYSLVARISPNATGDMRWYYNVAESGIPPLTLYWMREPIVWLGSVFLYQLTGNRLATFLIIDIAAGLLVIRAMKMLDDGDNRMLSFAPTIISSYVLLLGQQNILRQHVAFAIFLLASAARKRNDRTAIGLLVLSVLAHNATALLAGYWLDQGCEGRRHYGPFVTVLGVVLMWIMFPVLGKSYSATGLNTEYLYVALVTGLVLLLIYATRGRGSFTHLAGVLNFIAYMPAVVILGSAQFERVAMMFLVVVLMDVYRYHGPLQLREAEAAALGYTLLVIPVFLFPNAFVMLL